MSPKVNIAIYKDVITKIWKFTHLKYPYETCGLLIGYKKTATDIYISRLVISPNIADSAKDHFLIAPNLQFSVQKYIRNNPKKNIEIIGVFHSHPQSPAYPSGTDVLYGSGFDLFWVISSTQNKQIKCFFIDKNKKINEYYFTAI